MPGTVAIMMLKTSKRTGIIIAAVVLIFVLSAVFYFLRPYKPPAKPDFQGFKPAALPAGMAFSGDELERVDYSSQGYSRFLYKFGVNDDELRIIESRAESYVADGPSCKGIGDVCRELVTAGGQRYTVAYGVYQGKPFGLEVKWLRDGTYITLAADDTVIDKYVDHDWGPFIDAFAPIDISTLQLQPREGHCCGG